jgi:hypothetical protein
VGRRHALIVAPAIIAASCTPTPHLAASKTRETVRPSTTTTTVTEPVPTTVTTVVTTPLETFTVVTATPVTSATSCTAIPAYIVERESGCQNVPNAQGSGCDGYYQICAGTWNGYGGYASALDAPKEVQDAKARELWDGGRGCGHWNAC